MKKTMLLACIGLFGLTMAAGFAADRSVVLRSGLNLVAASLVPYDPTPAVVFRDDADPTPQPITIHNMLTRYDAVNKGYVTYNKRDTAAYGKVMLGDGAWLTMAVDGVYWKYSGVPNGIPDTAGKKTDIWISLPKAGLNLIGHPFATNELGETRDTVVWANCLMTNGDTTITVAQARTSTYGWTDGNATGYNADSKSYFTVGSRSNSEFKVLEPDNGYWVKTNIDNLALIIPARTDQ